MLSHNQSQCTVKENRKGRKHAQWGHPEEPGPEGSSAFRATAFVMSIDINLGRLLLDRRMSLTELSERVGVTLANLSILKTGRSKAIRFSTLNALCRVLECQPSDLLSFRSEQDVERERRT